MNPLHHHTHSIRSRLSECIEEIEEQVHASGAYMGDLLLPAQEIFCDLAEESLEDAEIAMAMGDAKQVGKHLDDLRAYVSLSCQCQRDQEEEEADLFQPSPSEKAEIEVPAV